jgi:nucleotide-binding universal stress UspA family protein
MAMKTKKVLIALDYDETSLKVAEEGYLMANAMNAETILLHVISEQMVYYSGYSYMHTFHVEILNDLHKSTGAFLNKAKNHLGDESIKVVIKEGDVAETILKTAKELNANILVMGSHSRKWLENVLLGSATEEVLKKTAIPLYIIPTKKISS